MKIVVLDGNTLNPGDNPWDEVAALGELRVYPRTVVGQVVDRARDAEVILTNKTPVPAAAIAALPRLEYVAVMATGYNVVDVAAARRRGIPVSNVPEYGTEAVAQFVFALLLTHCHQVARHDAAVRAGRWQASGDFCFWETPLVELAGLAMGIVGFGRIGRRVGQIANALGMSVLACDLAPAAPPPWAPFAWTDLQDLFSRSDVVSLHCPQTTANAGFVDAALLARMKPSAVLINTARGGLIDAEALAAALRNGALGAAALDVAPAEPLPADSPLLAAPNLLLTPHIAWATQAARRRLMQMTAANVRSFLQGRPDNVVN
jgi:glycerate dehydrogenase